MARPIWRGSISFGLVSIPVGLFAAEKAEANVQMHLLDKKTHTRIHNQRVNELGKEVAWSDIDHAYEFEKGKYVVVDPKKLEQRAAEDHELIQISSFVPLAQIAPIYFAKPYYLLPSEYSAKSYVLLHDILQRTKKVGIAKVVIKTREHLAMIMPQKEFLSLIILRYAHSLRSAYELLKNHPVKEKYKITAREMELAEQLVASMSDKWDPKDYHDESRELLMKLIKTKIKSGKAIGSKEKHATKKSTNKAAQVIDFSDLLQKSMRAKTKTNAKTKAKAKTRQKNNHHQKE